jgi:alcohol dehydrogenase (NADP+)
MLLRIVPIEFAPIGLPTRPYRDRTSDDAVDIEEPVIVSGAKRPGVQPATVCVKWADQRGQVPFPFPFIAASI